MGPIAAVTRYLFISHEPQEADALLLPGSPFPETAELAARLFREGFAPLLVCSGSRWLFHRESGGRRDECDAQAEAAMQNGVPASAILKEGRARHTLENARLSRLMLDGAGVSVKTAIVCCQSFHARRCQKAYGRYFRDAKLLICPVKTRGFDQTDWWKTPVGVFKAITELLKCTGLFFFLISLVRAK